MLGLVVAGLRTWICTTAAPALAASMQDRAICSGVTGTAGFFPGESADPVTAHEMITLRCMAVTLLQRHNPPHKRGHARLDALWNPSQRPPASRSWPPVADQPQARFP